MRLKLEELKLTLSEEKTLITNARNEMAKFLGTHIKKYATNRGTIFHDVARCEHYRGRHAYRE